MYYVKEKLSECMPDWWKSLEVKCSCSNPATLNSFVDGQILKPRGGTKACGKCSSRPGPRGIQHIIVLMMGPHVDLPEKQLFPPEGSCNPNQRKCLLSNFQIHPYSKNRIQLMQWNVRDMDTWGWEMGIEGSATSSFEPADGQNYPWRQYWYDPQIYQVKSNDRPPHHRAFPRSHELMPVQHQNWFALLFLH